MLVGGLQMFLGAQAFWGLRPSLDSCTIICGACRGGAGSHVGDSCCLRGSQLAGGVAAVGGGWQLSYGNQSGLARIAATQRHPEPSPSCGAAVAEAKRALATLFADGGCCAAGASTSWRYSRIPTLRMSRVFGCYPASRPPPSESCPSHALCSRARWWCMP